MRCIVDARHPDRERSIVTPMPAVAAESMRGEFLSQRAFDASPFSPAWNGLLVALSVALLYAAHAYGAAWLFGWTPQRAPLWVELLLAVAIGYAPTLAAYSVRGTRRDAEELRPVIAYEARLARVLTVPLDVPSAVSIAARI